MAAMGGRCDFAKHFMRTCQEPFSVGDVTFQPRDLLYLSYASANRDEEVFPDPFRLDVRRENAASHLAFGFRRHFCLRAHLARMEIRAIFRDLLGRLDHIELVGVPTWIQAYFVQGPRAFRSATASAEPPGRGSRPRGRALQRNHVLLTGTMFSFTLSDSAAWEEEPWSCGRRRTRRRARSRAIPWTC